MYACNVIFLFKITMYLSMLIFVFTNQQITPLIATGPTISRKLEMRRYPHNNIGEKRHSRLSACFHVEWIYDSSLIQGF